MIKGSYVALVTPFKNNEIDYNAFELLLDFHIENKTDGILLCGTTGESPALAGDEKERFIRFGIARCKGKIPVMVGTGTNNLSHTLAATERAQSWGADSALVITPYYNKPNQTGLYHYFKAVSDHTDIPLIIYNVPGRTGVNISSETLLKLAEECSSIIGIKEASGDLTKISRIVRDADEDFSVLSGEDDLNYAVLCSGGKGVISVTANIVPAEIRQLVSLCEQHKYTDALQIHLELLELNSALFIETNPIPVKAALHMMGKITDEIRLPLFHLNDKNLSVLQKTLSKYNLIKD
ncbi:MAG: 4-hydroxy-tetrahydrodipicolinate synthase [Candidatus Cloacimonetes bacterium]|nr:4-hydroxy-tetrahydrodipicolinate synthase [Candidatus Cloacimonadota bacterium]